MAHRREHLCSASQLWLPHPALCIVPPECFWGLRVWSGAVGSKSGKLRNVADHDMCAKRCAIVCKRCARCTQVHKRCGRVRKCARRCAEGCAGGARARAEWAGGAGVVGAGPVQRKSKVENFRKCACFDRAYHENLTWRGLWGWHKARRCVGGVPVEFGGQWQPGWWWKPEWVHTHV